MRTYEDNVEAINQLWQAFTPTHELRQLFREKLSKLDQAVLYEAIKQAKVDNEGPWPAIKWFTVAYAEVQRKRRESTPKTMEKHTRTILPDIDTEQEKRLVADFQLAIQGCNDEGFKHLEGMILDKMSKELLLSSLSTHRLLHSLQVHLGYGAATGLSRVTKDGDLEPMQPTIDF